MRGAARASRLFAIPTTCANVCRARGGTLYPQNSCSGRPCLPHKAAQGDPAHPAEVTSLAAWDRHPRSRFQPKAMNGGAQAPRRRGAAPTNSLPALPAQKWHKHPILSPLPPSSRGLQQLFCSGETYGSFYNQSATPSRLFFFF